ncbi:MAG: hypothetical protein GXP25_24470 [Planctomycetes bacterium]|nr:hypothetical protein [Planctomycetota bacterium]
MQSRVHPAVAVFEAVLAVCPALHGREAAMKYSDRLVKGMTEYSRAPYIRTFDSSWASASTLTFAGICGRIRVL